jgi:hypothetical protein
MSENEISIHDNDLLGYEVRGPEHEIVLKTEYRDGPLSEKTDVVFNQVLAYNFINDSFGTILYGVAEMDINNFVEENWDLFEAGRKWGWPGAWVSTKENTKTYLAQNSIRAYSIGSSIGMSGWVLAKTVKHIAHPKS